MMRPLIGSHCVRLPTFHACQPGSQPVTAGTPAVNTLPLPMLVALVVPELQIRFLAVALCETSTYDPYQDVFNAGVHRCSNAAEALHTVVSCSEPVLPVPPS